MSRVLFNEKGSDKLSADENYQRLLLDELLEQSRTYKNSRDYQELLDFVGRFPDMAPFNAMLLHMQKPGLQYAATLRSWWESFGRRVKERARPLIILRPFGPVDFVYDVVDTEGAELPKDVRPFRVKGDLRWDWRENFEAFLRKIGILTIFYDHGDGDAGFIRRIDGGAKVRYEIGLNRNHESSTLFVTYMHELAHLFLGHLGDDQDRKIKGRTGLPFELMEIEAESVAYLVAKRWGLKAHSQSYLSRFIEEEGPVSKLDIYMIMKATTKVEKLVEGF